VRDGIGQSTLGVNVGGGRAEGEERNGEGSGKRGD